MLRAFLLGGVAQSTLLLAGLSACWVRFSRTTIGVLAGFGPGGMLAAISFDLVGEAHQLDLWEFALWAFVGVAVFLAGDAIVDRRFGDSGEAGTSAGWPGSGRSSSSRARLPPRSASSSRT